MRPHFEHGERVDRIVRHRFVERKMIGRGSRAGADLRGEVLLDELRALFRRRRTDRRTPSIGLGYRHGRGFQVIPDRRAPAVEALPLTPVECHNRDARPAGLQQPLQILKPDSSGIGNIALNGCCVRWTAASPPTRQTPRDPGPIPSAGMPCARRYNASASRAAHAGRVIRLPGAAEHRTARTRTARST